MNRTKLAEMIEKEHWQRGRSLRDLERELGAKVNTLYKQCRREGIATRSQSEQTSLRNFVSAGVPFSDEWMLRYVSPEPVSGCWLWLGNLDKCGYGRVGPRVHKSGLASRAFYHHFRGDLSDLYACHHCDNPACVNPDHLFLGSQKDNMRDCASKGRLVNKKGESHGAAKLSTAKVLSIREEYACGGATQQKLAEKHGVCQTTISSVCRRKNWKSAQPDVRDVS